MKTPKTIIAPDASNIKDEEVRRVLEQIFTLLELNHKDYRDDLSLDVVILPVNDTTPSVRDKKTFVTANTAGTAITDFDDAQDGQRIIIICNDVNTSIADAGNFKLSAAWAPNADDTISLVHYGGTWYEYGRATN